MNKRMLIRDGILLVDDEIEILNPLQEMLEEEGIQGSSVHKSYSVLNLMRVQALISRSLT